MTKRNRHPDKKPRITPVYFFEHREALAARRGVEEVTQVEMGELIGCSHSKVGRIENDNSPYDEYYLEDFARACGVPIAHLFFKPNEAPVVLQGPQIAALQEVLAQNARLTAQAKPQQERPKQKRKRRG